MLPRRQQASNNCVLSWHLHLVYYSLIFTVHIWKTELSPDQYAIWKVLVSISGAKWILKSNSYFLLTEPSVSCCRNVMPVLLKKKKSLRLGTLIMMPGDKTHIRRVCISCQAAAHGSRTKRRISIVSGSQEQDRECYQIYPRVMWGQLLRSSESNYGFLSRLSQSRTWRYSQTSTLAWTCQVVLTVCYETNCESEKGTISVPGPGPPHRHYM